jgi:hypothetical protein
MQRHLRIFSDLVLTMAVVLLGGCTFKKATPGAINPPEPVDGAMDIVYERPDLNLPPMVDAAAFEADVTLNCIEANPQTMNIPPDILMVFDRSGSMNNDLTDMTCMGGCGVNSKWSVATTTVEAFLPMVETTVNWGLKLFASSGNCNVSATADVAPGPMNAAAITTQLGQTMPSSQTPTTLAIMAAATYLNGLNDGSPKFILLATDGIPTCGSSACAPGVNGGNNQCDDANAIAAVQTVHDTMGIPTFVLGIGTANSPGDATLSMMAVNGGFPRNDTPSYYPIGNANDLTAAFATITKMVGQCYFAVTPVPKDQKSITGVTGDGNPIPQDPTDGWTFVTMGATAGVQLNGKSCDDYKSKAIQTVKVDLPCIEP